MKKSTILKIWGLIQLGFGIILIILGVSVFADHSFMGGPNFAFLVPGIFIAFFSWPIIFAGFAPELAKLRSNLEKETFDYAGEDIKQATEKKADTIIPAITPAIKEAVKEIKGKKTLEELLFEAERLLKNNIITEEEYQLMRKNILGIK